MQTASTNLNSISRISADTIASVLLTAIRATVVHFLTIFFSSTYSDAVGGRLDISCCTPTCDGCFLFAAVSGVKVTPI